MKRWLSITVLLAVIACSFSLSFAADEKVGKATYTYTGGITGRVKNIIDPPLLTGPAKLVWDPKQKTGKITLTMVGGMAECDVASSGGESFSGQFSCQFTGFRATGPLKGALSDPNSSGIPQKMEGSFDITIPEQGSAEYIGTFNGELRNW